MKQLSTREKNTLILGGAMALVFLAVQFVCLPVLDRRKDLALNLAVEQDALKQMVILQEQYRNFTRGMDREQTIMAARPDNFTLFSFLDSQAEKNGVKQNIDYMRPFSQDADDGAYLVSRVRLRLTNLYLNDLIAFIKGVETPGNGVHIISLSLSRTGERSDLLEAVMEAQTFMKKELP